ncbi:MAG: putative toxin-antitoxin system toxin component, PIN family [Lysobacter spongiicola]|nr:putative toxin-antitoxin system toxin component, PIN family [Lysobacter spongiicola]
MPDGIIATSAPADAMPPRIVLDTNVWLDLLVFDNPRRAELREAMHLGEVLAVTNSACREEWIRVLRYPILRLDPPAIESLEQAFDAIAHDWSAAGTEEPGLPRCSDPDDQKFLQLAHDAGARWLLSRDRAVLALARRCRREGRFAILPPEAWPSPAGTS